MERSIEEGTSALMSNNDTAAQRGLWLAVIVLAAAFLAVCSAALLHALGVDTPTCLGAGGITFATTMTLCIAAWRFLRE
jgi:hypothetical protein